MQGTIFLEVVLLTTPVAAMAISPTPTPFWEQAPVEVMEKCVLETPTPILTSGRGEVVSTQTPTMMLEISPSPTDTNPQLAPLQRWLRGIS